MPLPHADWPLASFLELAALETAVPCARRHTLALLKEWGLGGQTELVEVTELLVSELMTNAYETTDFHGIDTPIRLRLASNRRLVLIEVWDGNSTPPPSVTALPSPDTIGGRGLFLVDTLSARWDWYTLSRFGGKVVWAEIRALLQLMQHSAVSSKRWNSPDVEGLGL
jgi:anti-sigma regulatory factor (Ser/Thr protein kinase)